jgi:hypothetical protein
MKIILKLKSWQLFAILFTPFILPGIDPLIGRTIAHELINQIWIVIYLLWLFVLGTNLHSKLAIQKQNRIGLLLFQFLVFSGIVSSLLIPFTISQQIPSEFVVAIYIFSAIGILFPMIYCAKVLTQIEKNQNPMLLNLVFLWIFPIGLWIIQPRIRDILKHEGA